VTGVVIGIEFETKDVSTARVGELTESFLEEALAKRKTDFQWLGVLGEAGGKCGDVDSNPWDRHGEEGIGSGVWDESDRREVPRGRTKHTAQGWPGR